MEGKRYILFLLLLFSLMSAVAEKGVRMRNCRPKARTPQAFSRNLHQANATNPYIGDRRQLVILASFNDQLFKEENPLPLWDRIFNEQGFSEGSFHGSVHDYFYAQSNGQLNLTFDLYDVALDESRVKYRSTAEDDENSKYLVIDLIEVMKTKGIDWSLYDWDGNGYVNQVLIVYAGKGQNAGGGSDTIWPHQWWLSEHEDCSPVMVSSGGKDYLIDAYCCVQEVYVNDDYSSFGTICHEYSHCFGLPDYYYGSTKFVGDWDLMDYGNNNGKGYCPPNYSAHEKMQMGWMTPTELTTATTVSDMDATQAYLIRNDGCEDEYYILENRQQTDWDSSLPGSGVVVFHIDYDEEAWRDFPNTPSLSRYAVIPANNRTSTAYSSGWAYPYGDNNQLTNGSEPAASLHHDNSDGGRLMNKPVDNIRVSGGLASFDFMGGVTDVSKLKVVGQPKILYDLGSIYIIRNAQGEIKKVMKH